MSRIIRIFVSNMNETELLELIGKAAQKDQKAQTQLINLHWVDVFTFVLRKVGDYNDADEITVNVFSKILAKLDLFDANFEFKTWILTIAQNTVIDYWRKKSRENKESTESLEEVKNQFAKSPEELLISDQEQEEIHRAISEMDSNYQEIIRLRFFEEMSIKEIAEELSLSISNTKVRIMRAKKLLAELLGDREDVN